MDYMNKTSYAFAIEYIMYSILCTWLDFPYALSVTSRYQTNFDGVHWVSVKNILKHLRRTENLFLIYRG